MVDATELIGQVLSPTFETEYVGTVVNCQDPEKNGRLKVKIPELYGTIPVAHLPWASPSAPFGGASGYGFFMIPKKGAKVRIKLWRGHPWFPVWHGVHWFAGEVPSEFLLNPPSNYGFKTPEGHILEYSDVGGKKYIKFTDVNGNFIKIDSEVNDRLDQIINDQKETIGNDRVVTIGGKWQVTITGECDITAGGNCVITSAGPCTVNSPSFITKGGTAALSQQATQLKLATEKIVNIYNTHKHDPGDPVPDKQMANSDMTQNVSGS